MDRLSALATFKMVVDCGSFRRAAEVLEVSNAKVSRTVLELESLLGAQLLQRSSRRLSLTSVGHEVLQRATELLDTYQSLTEWSRRTAIEPVGAVRVGAPAALARHLLVPALTEFMRVYPGISVNLRTRDASADVFDEEVDLLLSLHNGLRPGLIARLIGHSEVGLYASPAYLARHPGPLDLESLLAHNCLRSDDINGHGAWHLRHAANGLSRELSVMGTLRFSHADVLLATMLEGAGIALLPQCMAAEYVARGECRRLLPAWTGHPLPIYLAWGSRRHLPSAVRALIDHLAGALSSAAGDGQAQLHRIAA